MKKLLVIILILTLTLSLWGCSSDLNEPANFYYPRQAEAIEFGSDSGLIAPEPREVAGHSGDLQYILSLYLGGPLDDTLYSPFPEGTKLEDIDLEEGTLIIRLSSSFSQLSGMELTLACACISSTCFDLTNANQVTVVSPKTDIYPAVLLTMDRDSLTLLDDVLTGSD